MKAKDFRAIAYSKLKGNWGTPLLTTWVASILGVFGIGAYSGSNYKFEEGEQYQGLSEELRQFAMTPAGKLVTSIFFVLLALISLWSIIRFIIGGSVELGYRKYTLNIVDGADAQFKDLFSYIKPMLIEGFLLQLLMDLFTILWALLLVIPGIIKSYSYCMAPFILAEHTDMKPKEAIQRSKELMNGNKWRLFCLEFSFIGWHILGGLTAGVLELWINPYEQISRAAFYRQICLERVED